MFKLLTFARAATILVSMSSTTCAQQPPVAIPEKSFKTVHLMAVEPFQKSALRTAVNNLNAELKRQHCVGCAYHLFQLFAGSAASYNYLVTADWPSGSEYSRVHDSAALSSVYARNPVFADLEAKQFYGRFVELR